MDDLAKAYSDLVKEKKIENTAHNAYVFCLGWYASIKDIQSKPLEYSVDAVGEWHLNLYG